MAIDLSEFQKALLASLGRHGVPHIVIGGIAVQHYCPDRETSDLDVWVAPEFAHSQVLYEAVVEVLLPLGCSIPSHEVLVVNPVLTAPKFSCGPLLEPWPDANGQYSHEVDVMLFVPGMDFDRVARSVVLMALADLRIPVASREDLVEMKQRAVDDPKIVDVRKRELHRSDLRRLARQD